MINQNTVTLFKAWSKSFRQVLHIPNHRRRRRWFKSCRRPRTWMNQYWAWRGGNRICHCCIRKSLEVRVVKRLLISWRSWRKGHARLSNRHLLRKGKIAKIDNSEFQRVECQINLRSWSKLWPRRAKKKCESDHKKTKANNISQSSARIHPMLTVETTVALFLAWLVNCIQVPIQASSSFDNLKFFWINIKHPKLVRKVQRFQRKHQRNSWGVRQTKFLMWLLMRLLNQKDYTK